jgi:putative SOS response-associated peptidase YedK
MRWGPAAAEWDAYYVTNVRNVASGFWKPWLKVEHRCIVLVVQFA